VYLIAADGTTAPVFWQPGQGIQFISPGGLAVDASGNLYVADDVTSQIAKIMPGLANLISDGGGSPESIALDTSGILYAAYPAIRESCRRRRHAWEFRNWGKSKHARITPAHIFIADFLPRTLSEDKGLIQLYSLRPIC
jgi:hypothetical protein